MRRYGLSALVEASGLSEAALARSVGLSGTTLKLARENGLREDAADRYAVRAGFAALEVWPDFGQRVCAECDLPFAQSRRGQRFCSERCRRRLNQRRWQNARYQSDPEFAARERERARAYYEACGEYVRKRNNERRRAARETSGNYREPSQIDAEVAA